MILLPSILANDVVRDLIDHRHSRCRLLVTTFAAGIRVPEIGTSCHEETEVSLVLSGSFDLQSGGECRHLGEGDLVVVPAGERHSFEVRAETRIFTLTIGDA
jgi:quercetin dioxygenase-like cupin family protein